MYACACLRVNGSVAERQSACKGMCGCMRVRACVCVDVCERQSEHEGRAGSVHIIIKLCRQNDIIDRALYSASRALLSIETDLYSYRQNQRALSTECTDNPTWGVIFESFEKLKGRTSLLPLFSEKRLSSFELFNNQINQNFRKCHPKWYYHDIYFHHLTYSNIHSNKLLL